MTKALLGGASLSAALAVGRIPTGSCPNPPATRHLMQTDLAGRWRVSERTLERWRWRKLGPPYLKVGGRVVYRLADVLVFEKAQLRAPDARDDPFFQKGR